MSTTARRGSALVLSGVMACATTLATAQERVPAEYQDLYALLDQKLTSFDATLEGRWDHSTYSVTFATELLTANGNRGRALLTQQAMAGVKLELDRQRALGIQAVVVAIPFPELYKPFLAWNGDPGDHPLFVNFFTSVVDEAHKRGMKVAIESAVMFEGIYSAGSGFNLAGYYPTLTADQFTAGRADVIATIAREIKPDLINVGSEPDTEYTLSGQSFLRTPQGFASMVRTIVERLAVAGLTDVPLAAGSGTWMYQAGAYVDALCAIPGLSTIDLHVYPVNLDFLDRALVLADTARAHGKRVTMLECWLQKERDSELGVIDSAMDPVLFARDAFSFWAPLDQRFLAAMVKYAHAVQLDYFSPFWSRYLFAYLDYDQVMAMQPTPSAADVISLATTAHAQALIAGRVTDTGLVYSWLIADPFGLPRLRRHLRPGR